MRKSFYQKKKIIDPIIAPAEPLKKKGMEKQYRTKLDVSMHKCAVEKQTRENEMKILAKFD